MYRVDAAVKGFSRADSNEFEEMLINEAERVKPIIKEQFLREYIFGLSDTDEIFNIYCRTFNVDSLTEMRMAILKPVGAKPDLFFLKNMAEQVIGEDNLFLCTMLSDYILIITSIIKQRELAECLENIRKNMKSCYDYDIVAIYSGILRISEAPTGHDRLAESVEYLFYAGGSDILYSGDIKRSHRNAEIKPQYSNVERAVKNGDADKVSVLLKSFFEALEASTPKPAVAKTYCLEMYVCIIRCCAVEKIDKYMKGIVEIQKSESLNEIKSFINKKAEEIVTANAPKNTRIYSALIKDTISIIEENVSNENLSLRWIAGNILYTNVDYLGKLFKKETGKNFSHYVMEKRMEMAKNLIIGGKKDRIYEVAEKVGYGSNSQYFSQVFKKYTGISPLEYKEFARTVNQNSQN